MCLLNSPVNNVVDIGESGNVFDFRLMVAVPLDIPRARIIQK